MKQQSSSIPAKSFWVEFVGDRSVKINEDQTILEASLASSIPHYHACGGNGECSTCRVFVQAGAEFLSPLSRKEQVLRKKIPFPGNVRLACQTYVTGPLVSLHRIIRDETDIKMYIDDNPTDDIFNTGHERKLALFFLDIRDFTPFLESYLPFDVIHMMRRLFGLFRKGIEQHEGRIIDTAGDGFYAVFGFETTISQAANQAFAAAQTILHDLDDFNASYSNKYFFHAFEVGIGIHAGNVITGNIGIGVNNNITVMGLSVNIAARIQALTKTCNNNLIVSDHFYHYLSPKPGSQQIETSLKGLKDHYHLHLCGRPYNHLQSAPS